MIIITGGAGFIGSNVVAALNQRGIDDILVVDDLTDGVKFRNLAGKSIADYLDKDAFRALIARGDAFHGVEAVFHQGACAVTTEWDGKFMMDTNYQYSKELLHWAAAREIPFIYASSAAVYGNKTGFIEEPGAEGPINPYGYSKLLFDHYVRRAGKWPNQVVGLRYFNVYGPGEAHKGSMASVAFHLDGQIRAEGKAKLFQGSHGYEDGEQRRDFVYSADIAALNLWFLEHRDVSGIFNAGTGQAESFNAVARAVIAWHQKGALGYIPFPAKLVGAYQPYTQANLTRLRAVGCDVAFRDVAAGVSDYLNALAQPSA